ncbi:MAG: type VI secretion system tip protein TssI/VgrG [Terriglobia bacterium]|jgi:type VI secretion system secreted protein VgrG
MSNYTQEGGLFKIDTPLGKDVLLLRGFKGTESISRLFRFELDLLSENSSISFPDIVGKNVTISLKQPDESYRYINGVISRFAQHATEEQFTSYSAEMVPWLWFLTRNADCRIFQNKSIPDIITEVFSDLGFNDYTNSTQGSYDPREYCVQYRESDFNFVSRLMEEYGILYFFKHQQGKHTLVLADTSTAHSPCPGQSSVRYVTVSGGPQEDVITGWEIKQELRPGKYSLEDYNFQTPSTNLMVNEPTVYEVGGNSKFEIYDYPGEYLTKGAGESLARVRMQEEEAEHLVAHGMSQCRMFVSGYKFTLEEHPRKDMNTDYVLTEIQHTAMTDAYATSRSPEGESYSNTFTCIPLSVPFRPLRITPRPTVKGLQPAVVTGPSGEEIYSDKYGRVKVQFFWDRLGKKNENSSCWIRVSQPWAGKNWGAVFLPRIGQEVIVDFLESDPDQPLITGRVYNAEQMPPYTLPDMQTRSTFQSRSSKGGGTANYNEIRFEDLKGSEQIFVNAEKDMDHRVENDSREYIGNNRHLIVNASQLELVNADKHLHVKGKQNEKIEGNMSLDVGGDQKQHVGGNLSLQVGQSRNEKVGATHAMEAVQTIHLKGGTTVIIEAGAQLSLKGPGGFVDIGPAGVTIQGTMVLINSGGAAGSGPGASPVSPDPPTDPDTADDGSKGTKL